VDRDVGIALLEGMIDALNAVSVPFKKRKEIYLNLFQVFESEGFEDFEELVSEDETRDRAYDSAYSGRYE
jgi:hypothetical protein